MPVPMSGPGAAIARKIARGAEPETAAAELGLELVDLRGYMTPRDTQKERRAHADHNAGEYVPLSSHWYYDAREPRNRAELGESVASLVDWFQHAKHELERETPLRLYIDNYGGAVVGLLPASSVAA